MGLETRDEHPATGEVIVEVAGCGVCHTDLGFFYDGVPTRRPFPLTLGHEISGRVVEAGEGASEWLGRVVVVPAVLPCGECDACRAGRGQVCPRQIFPGSDVHGGFGSHVRVPARGLCPVPDLADRGRPIITTCETGEMAALGGKLLKDMGFTNVRILKGGTVAWKEACYPTNAR